MTRRKLVSMSAATLMSLAASTVGMAADRVKIVVGSQDAAFPQIVEASNVLDGAPYDVEWAVLPGPAAQLAALYSRATDVGMMGDTSLVIEQGRAKKDWTAGSAPLQIVAGWCNPDKVNYPGTITAVRNDSGISSLIDLRGKKWANNFGGYNYAQFLLSRIKAGLKPSEIQSVQLVDTNATGAAFNSGRVDVYSGALWAVKETIDQGKARILFTADQLDIPALYVFASRPDVIQDPEKGKALHDFLDRVRKQWSWYDAHVDVAAQIWEEKVKQTPAKSDFNARNGRSIFVRLDDDLIAREQKIADVLAETGDIAKKIDVSVEFAKQFNDATVPGPS